MADNLKIFGTPYYDVQGQKFTDLDGNEKTYIRPVGTKQIAQNGTADVKKFEFAEVAVPASAVDEGTKQITQNGDGQDVVGYAAVDVNVPGIVPAGTKQINQNGTHDVAQYASAEVNVPNTYAASDEGKVIHNGALTAQTSGTATENGTVDTTLINSLTVNVSGGGGNDDLAKLIQGTLTSIDDSTVTSVRAYAFRGATALQRISLPNATTIATNAFFDTSGLTSVYLPNVTSFSGGNHFEGSGIPILVFPKLTEGSGSYVFRNNSHLQAIDFGKSLYIRAQWFANDSNLATIILRGTEISPLSGGTAVFNNTPFKSGGTGGTIYIPKVLYDHLGDGTSYDYKAATGWTTVNGYGTITWTQIEGSIYETQYADGTPIPTT